MALNTYALITSAYARQYAGTVAVPSQVSALTLYHDGGTSSTAATVQISGATMSLVVTGGANAGTSTITLTSAANDTFTELASVINALNKGWVAEVVSGMDAAASVDLVDIAATSVWGIAAKATLLAYDNAQLENAINACSLAIENWLGRIVKSRTLHERFIAERGGIRLRGFPATRLTRLAVAGENAITVRCTATDASWATAEVQPTTDVTNAAPNDTAATLALVVSGGSLASSNDIDLTSTSYDTLGELVTYIDGLSAWTATLAYGGVDAGNHKSSDLEVCGAQGAIDALTLFMYSRPEYTYTFSQRSGVITGLRCGRPYLASYIAGYTTVPDDIQFACAKLVKQELDRSRQLGGLRSESIGDYSYTRGGEIVDISIIGEVAQLLAPYRNVLI